MSSKTDEDEEPETKEENFGDGINPQLLKKLADSIEKKSRNKNFWTQWSE